MKKLLIIPSLLLLLSSASAVSAHAASFYLLFGCSYSSTSACPNATTIFADISLTKSTYAPGETVFAQADYASDDNPQFTSTPPGVSPIAYAKIDGAGYSWSADMFPESYTPQNLRDGIISSPVSLGAAPVTPGSYTASVQGGSGGYIMVSKPSSEAFIVTSPSTPTVNVHF